MNFDQKIILVTGASRGIGAAIADAFAHAGAIVIGTATSQSGAEAVQARLNAINPNSAGLVLNVTEKGSIEAIIGQIETQFGTIYALINNAGITRDGLLMRMKEEDWDALMDTNLKSVFLASKAVMRAMMKVKVGRIINIASIIGVMGNAGQANYAAAKAGIIGFTKSMAREVGSRNITVNCVAPGFIDTDMTRDLPEAQKEAMIANIALGRLGNPQDIADAVLFLASPQANYITGQTLHVNGGMLMP
ncbi:MAG: 3-oxoacyl-ACP reductase FabG [Neisseriaceae bacterium]|nr:3-oxoacyl-ACP reductase FabG [Neisseriaceae bacterium]